MSQEQPPVRSRRELRKARDEALGKNQDAGTPGAGGVAPASKQPAATGQGRCSAHRRGPTPGQQLQPWRLLQPGHRRTRPPGGSRPRGFRAGRLGGRAFLPDQGPGPRRPANHQGAGGKGRAAFRRRAAHAPPAPADAAQGTGSHLGHGRGPACSRRSRCPACRAWRGTHEGARVRLAMPSSSPRRKPAGRRPAAVRGRAGRDDGWRTARRHDCRAGPRGPCADRRAGQEPARQDGAHRGHGPRSRGPGDPGRADCLGRTGGRAQQAGHGQAETG